MEQLGVTAGQAANYLVAPSAVRLDDRGASRGSVCERDKYASMRRRLMNKTRYGSRLNQSCQIPNLKLGAR